MDLHIPVHGDTKASGRGHKVSHLHLLNRVVILDISRLSLVVSGGGDGVALARSNQTTLSKAESHKELDDQNE